jgi:hypothetical protein
MNQSSTTAPNMSKFKHPREKKLEPRNPTWRRTSANNFINAGAAGLTTRYEAYAEPGGELLLVGRDSWEGGFAWQVQRDGKVISQGKSGSLRMGKVSTEYVATLSNEKVEELNKELMIRTFLRPFA